MGSNQGKAGSGGSSEVAQSCKGNIWRYIRSVFSCSRLTDIIVADSPDTKYSAVGKVFVVPFHLADIHVWPWCFVGYCFGGPFVLELAASDFIVAGERGYVLNINTLAY